jgi:hypothetical protein
MLQACVDNDGVITPSEHLIPMTLVQILTVHRNEVEVQMSGQCPT